MINKKYLPLYLALAIPLLMIILIAAFIYIPSLGFSPKHNFIYLSGYNINYYPPYSNQAMATYQVINGKLVYTPPSSVPINSGQPVNPAPHLYLYDAAKNSSMEINLSQAQSYTLDPSNVSDDGYTVEHGNYDSGFPFGGSGDYNNWYIKGHNRSIKLNLKFTGDYSNFQFLGWVQN